jgi:hypothetical protein
MRKTFPGLALLMLLAAVVVSGGCAKKRSPPGGPPDTTSPFVEGISPLSGSVGVDAGAQIMITFSESMKKRTVETGVIVSPPCGWKKRHWKDETYIMVPDGGLRPETTYLVSVSNKAKDSHGVSMKSTFVSGFSTGDSLDSGVISGTVVWKKMDVEGAVIELYEAEAVDTLGGLLAEAQPDPLYVTLSGQGGVYEIPFVDIKKRYRLFSFIDKDLDADYDTKEQVGCHAGIVEFAAGTTLSDVLVTICGEELGGTIVGRVDTSSVPDTLSVSLAACLVADSAKVYEGAPKPGGEFELRCLEPGSYRLEAFYDLNRNQKKDPEDSFFVEVPGTLLVEPCKEPVEVEITFGDDERSETEIAPDDESSGEAEIDPGDQD